MAVFSKKKEPKGQESHHVLAGLKKQHGDQIGTFGHGYAPVGRVPSGIFPLDLAVGGGFPLWRHSTLFGPESSSKTAVGLRLLGSVQHYLKRTAVLIDAEHVYDPVWTALFGVDLKKLIVIQPDNGEQVIDAVEGMLNADDVGIVLLDSLATVQPQRWIEAEADKANVGGNTQIVSRIYTKAGRALSDAHKLERPVMFVVINQIRYKLDVRFGDPEITPGGKGPMFATSLSLRFYGKKVYDKAVGEDMPVHMLVSGQVRKWRVPIIGTSFEYKLCLTPHEGYQIGQTIDTWKTVAHRLQATGDLAKNGKGWMCIGYTEPTLDKLEERYISDPEWQFACQKRVLENSQLIKVAKVNALKS
jgi:recombination protein RecA